MTTAQETTADELVDLAMAARDEHVFMNTTTCTCGFKPSTSVDWERHRMGVALDAVIPRG